MDAYPKTRTWPYVVMVVALFILAATFPHWQRDWQDVRARWEKPEERVATLLAKSFARCWMGGQNATLIDLVTDHDRATAVCRQGEHPSSLASIVRPTAPPFQPPVSKRVERPPVDFETRRRPGWQVRPAGRRVAVDASPEFSKSDVQPTAPKQPLTTPADAPIEISESDADQLSTALPTATSASEGEPSKPRPRPSAWPLTVSLNSMLDELPTNTAQVGEWKRNVVDTLARLRAQRAIDSSAVPSILDQLTESSQKAPYLEDYLVEAEQILLRQIAYAIDRRLAVWRAAHQLALEASHPNEQHNDSQPLASLQAVQQRINQHPYAAAWRRYLMLDKLLQIASEDWQSDPAVRRKTARLVLQRLDDSELTAEQQAFLDHREFDDLAPVLKKWAAPNVNLSEFLQTLEQFQATRASATARQLVDGMHDLAFSPHSAAHQLRNALNLHFRNANIRLTIRGSLMNDLLPVLSPIQHRIDDRILGADVIGRNRTWTDLKLSLVQDDQRIRMRIEADGTSRSRTVSSKGPVRFLSRDSSRFNAGKELIASPEGIFVSRATAQASNRSQLLGVESDYDEIPLLGWIIRQIALDEHRESRPLLRREVRRRVQNRASRQLDSSIHKKLAGAEQRINQAILQPLRNLDLDPHAIEMKTTQQRVVMRVRLAGPGQLAAYTPRPRAMANNVLSFQLHESAANNVLEKLGLAGTAFRLEELVDTLTTELGIERNDLQAELPEGVYVRLGNDRPIQFKFAANRVLVIIKLQELKTSRRTYRNFIVRGRYRADVEQTHVNLQRDGGIELISEKIGFRDQIALRGIFTKVMAHDHRLNIVQGRIKQNAELNKLGVTQFVVRDGWIGLSIGPLRRDRVARK